MSRTDTDDMERPFNYVYRMYREEYTPGSLFLESSRMANDENSSL